MIGCDPLVKEFLIMIEAPYKEIVLSSFKDPERVIGSIFESLAQSGYLYAADVGRRVNLWDWTKYMTLVSLMENGLLSTMKLFMNLSTE